MLGGISIWQLLIVLGIVILIFGTKKLRNLGGDLGGAIKSFKKAVSDEDAKVEGKKEQTTYEETNANAKTKAESEKAEK